MQRTVHRPWRRLPLIGMVERGEGGMPLPGERWRVDPPVPGARPDTSRAGTISDMRIIAGTHRGQRIAAPRGIATRPTSDRVRENAFNLIGPVDGADVLDLFAGSGALGLEALSRGADRVVFVESDRDACRTINANLDKLKLHGTVLCQDVLRAVGSERRAYDLVLCDPPYDFDRTRLAPQLARLLQPDGLLVYESSGREQPPEVPLLTETTSRKYGSARLTLYRR